MKPESTDPAIGPDDADDAVTHDAEARRRIRESLDESLLVEAAAGTGKTTVLVDRLVRLLAAGGARVDRVVAVTFTRKAAGELKLRLRQELDRARTAVDPSRDPERHVRLSEAIARLEEAHIGTIHSFCTELLRRRPVEAGIDPAFTELDDEESNRLYEQVFRRWIGERLNNLPPGLERVLHRLATGSRSGSGSDASPIERLLSAGRQLVDWRDFDTPWQLPEVDLATEINRLVDQCFELYRLRARGVPRDPLYQALDPLEDLVTWIERSEELSERRDFAEIEALLIRLLGDLRWNDRRVGRTVNYAADLPRKKIIAERDRLIAELNAFDQLTGAHLAALMQRELGDVLERYAELKRLNGSLDFLDLLIRCRDLLRTQATAREYFQNAFDCIFIDEFQDTDPLQAEILLLLSADDPESDDWRRVRPRPGKLFLVGDPKQSIYRFRRADVLLYQSVADQLEQAGVAKIHLNRSFRAGTGLRRAINDAFTRAMGEDRRAGQPAYVALRGDRPSPPDQPSLVALSAPKPFGYRNVSNKEIEASLPEAVAAYVDWLVNQSGWKVQEGGDGQWVPIRPRHICLLFRRFVSWDRDVTTDYLRHLESRGVDHVLVGGRSFHQREEVEALRSALTAIEWPDDTLAVYATLRGELFGFTDDLLLRFMTHVGPLQPLAVAELDMEALEEQAAPWWDDELLGAAEALEVLARLHRRRNQAPIAQTLHQLLDFARAQAGFAFRPAGNQVLVNVQRIIDMARGFEIRGGLSFRGFVEHLDRAADGDIKGGSPMLEEGAEGVRLMTTHSAKGLEFPVVILADPTCKQATKDPGRLIDAERRLCAQRLLRCSPLELQRAGSLELDRDRAEGVRLAYVAATRARDLLVVTGVGTGPRPGGWLSPLDEVIFPPTECFTDARPAPGCPSFGNTTILAGPRQFDPHAPPPVRPGLHRSRAGGDVVWWDPQTLRLGLKGNFGVRHHHLLVPDEEGDAHEEGLDAYTDWIAERERALESGARPSHEVIVVTETERMPEGSPPHIELIQLPRSADRPAGRRFGTLVHTVLRDVPLPTSDGPSEQSLSRLAQLVELHGGLLNASAEERRATVDTVAAVLAHPLLVEAAGASQVLRETPFQLPLEGGYLIEGVFDLAFRQNGEWTVVDFKTDTELAARSTAYKRQISWYAHALSSITGEPCRGVLLGL